MNYSSRRMNMITEPSGGYLNAFYVGNSAGKYLLPF